MTVQFVFNHFLDSLKRLQNGMQALHSTSKHQLLAKSPIAGRYVSSSSRRCKCVNYSKRDTLVALLSLPAAAAGTLDWLSAQPAEAAAAASSMTAAANPAAAVERDPMFYATWPYAGPADILPYIQQQATPGNSQMVLDAMDTFSQYYPQYKIGPEKGALLEKVPQQQRPHLALELGTFLGYSAIRTARCLAPGGRLICVEANPDNAAVARETVAFAGLSDKVTIITGLSGQVIPTLPAFVRQQQQQQQQEQWQQPQAGNSSHSSSSISTSTSTNTSSSLEEQQQQLQQQLSFDIVFLDHCKYCYLPDLQALEQLGLLKPGTTVLADNVIYPGAPGYLEYLDSSGRFRTQLLKAKYEYEQAWNPDWEPNKQDALSVSVYVAEVA